jgi:hypothetical protein
MRKTRMKIQKNLMMTMRMRTRMKKNCYCSIPIHYWKKTKMILIH